MVYRRLFSESMDVTMTPQYTDAKLRLGYAIRLRRKELEISIDELARRAGMNRRYINEVELGKRNIAIVNIDKLARTLGIPIAALFSEYGADYQQSVE